MTFVADDWDCEPEDERTTYPVSEHEVIAYLQNKLLTKPIN